MNPFKTHITVPDVVFEEVAQAVEHQESRSFKACAAMQLFWGKMFRFGRGAANAGTAATEPVEQRRRMAASLIAALEGRIQAVEDKVQAAQGRIQALESGTAATDPVEERRSFASLFAALEFRVQAVEGQLQAAQERIQALESAATADKVVQAASVNRESESFCDNPLRVTHDACECSYIVGYDCLMEWHQLSLNCMICRRGPSAYLDPDDEDRMDDDDMDFESISDGVLYNDGMETVMEEMGESQQPEIYQSLYLGLGETWHSSSVTPPALQNRVPRVWEAGSRGSLMPEQSSTGFGDHIIMPDDYASEKGGDCNGQVDGDENEELWEDYDDDLECGEESEYDDDDDYHYYSNGEPLARHTNDDLLM